MYNLDLSVTWWPQISKCDVGREVTDFTQLHTMRVTDIEMQVIAYHLQ